MAIQLFIQSYKSIALIQTPCLQLIRPDDDAGDIVMGVMGQKRMTCGSSQEKETQQQASSGSRITRTVASRAKSSFSPERRTSKTSLKAFSFSFGHTASPSTADKLLRIPELHSLEREAKTSTSRVRAEFFYRPYRRTKEQSTVFLLLVPIHDQTSRPILVIPQASKPVCLPYDTIIYCVSSFGISS